MKDYIGHESQLYGVEEHRLVGGKGDGIGAAMVGVRPVHAIGGDLDRHSVNKHRHRSVTKTGLHGTVIRKNGKRLLRARRRRHIKIRGPLAT